MTAKGSTRRGAWLAGVAIAVVLAGCGSSSSSSGGASSSSGGSSGGPPSGPTTAPTGSSGGGGGGVFTTSTGFRFRVLAGVPRTVAQYTDAGNAQVAPAGKEYVEILVNFTNLQGSAAPLMDLVAPARVPSVIGAVPASQVAASSCLAASNGDKLPGGLCIDDSVTGYLLLADGNDVQAALNLMETPSVPANGSLRASFYYGPVATSFDTSSLQLFIGNGAGATAQIPKG